MPSTVSASSTRTTASAPSGSGAPVITFTAVPGATATVGTEPAATVASTGSSAGGLAVSPTLTA